jgi:hypothetical protein
MSKMKKPKSQNNQPEKPLTQKVIVKRRDDALHRALTTPPKPLDGFKGKTIRSLATQKSRAT